MSRLQSVTEKLIAINDAVFQELCDSFLAIRNVNYSLLKRVGSMSGKQKTTKGTPDSLLLLPNGKYIFVEHSTNLTEGLSKLKKDILSCLTQSKAKIKVSEISEIIFCINFNLEVEEIEELKQLLNDTRIILTIYTLDLLAIELNFNHRDLVHEYLGLPLDTGQIVSIERFIKEYQNASNGIATPLDNTFVHRDKELRLLLDYLKKRDFIILTGAPGVGKTKLSIEAINQFLVENLDYQAYCISYKSHTLLDDLYQHLDTNKNFVLFVDDANRIDAFNQVTGFYKAVRSGKLKIIITVRDYAYQEIGILSEEFNPVRMDIEKFDEKQITDLIMAKPFEILNSDYQKEILRISDGNPRLAIMASMLAKREQNLYVLLDVSDLFDNYFSTFIKDKGEFGNSGTLKCLGIIGFFFVIPYKDKAILLEILNNFDVDYFDFIETIDRLEKLEIVEIQFEHVKITEQNLSTYFFYKVFIKDSLLSFDTLLKKYFLKNQYNFKDTVIASNNTFGPEKVMNKLQPSLRNYFKEIDEAKKYEFLSTFWFYLQEEALLFLFSEINSIPNSSITEYSFEYNSNSYAFEKDKILELLGNFFWFEAHLKDSLELAFEYAEKKPQITGELVHTIKEHLIFENDDEWKGYSRQIKLYDFLIEGLNRKNKLISEAFFEISKTFLKFSYRHVKGGYKKSAIYLYSFTLSEDPLIYSFRENIFNSISEHYSEFPELALQLLNSYIRPESEAVKSILEMDLKSVIPIIEKHLKPESFDDCLFVNSFVLWCYQNLITHDSLAIIKGKYTNPTYELYTRIDWDRFRDKESYEFTDYTEYEKLKESDIRSFFIFYSEDEFEKFYTSFLFIKHKVQNSWNYNKVLDIIIDENYTKNKHLGIRMLELIIRSGNDALYVPWYIFRNHLKSKQEATKLWNIIHGQNFKHATQWRLSFFDYINEELISKKFCNELIKTLEEADESLAIFVDRINRFLKVDSLVFQRVLRTTVEVNKKGGIRLKLWADFFDKYFHYLGDDITIVKTAYIQQRNFEKHYDYDGKGFLKILHKDPKFLIEFIDDFVTTHNSDSWYNRQDLSFVWEVIGIEQELEIVFDKIIDKDKFYGIGEHFCNSFFTNLPQEFRDRADQFLLNYLESNYTTASKVNAIVDIVRRSRKELYENVVLKFIELTQDVTLFNTIWWRGNGGSYSGNVIIGDIEASEWRNVLSIVEKSQLGVKLLPIKKYINDKIQLSLMHGDWERKRRFLERH